MSYMQERGWFGPKRMRSSRDLYRDSTQNWNVSRRSSINLPRRGRVQSSKSRPSYSRSRSQPRQSYSRGRIRFQGSRPSTLDSNFSFARRSYPNRFSMGDIERTPYASQNRNYGGWWPNLSLWSRNDELSDDYDSPMEYNDSYF